MSTFLTILLIIGAIILFIGLIRVIISPSNGGLLQFLMELMLIDWIMDALGWVFETISDLWD